MYNGFGTFAGTAGEGRKVPKDGFMEMKGKVAVVTGGGQWYWKAEATEGTNVVIGVEGD